MMSLAIVAFTATDNFMLALPCVFVAGAAMVITGIGAQTLIQASVDRSMAGRVMALYGMIFRACPGARARVIMGMASVHLGCACRSRSGRSVSFVCWALTLPTASRAIVASLEDTLPMPARPAAPERGA